MKHLIPGVFRVASRFLGEIKTVSEYFYFKLFYRPPSLPQNYSQKRLLVCGEEDLKTSAEHFRKIFPQQVEAKIEEADRICAHVFDLLGSGFTKLGKEGEVYQRVDWHSDFKARYRWDPGTFYKKIKYSPVPGVDIKVPWELSRFQHLNSLGQAHILAGGQKYQEEFVNQVTDWIEANPVAFGVNWSSTMDVAIRVANWLVAKEFFKEKILPKEFLVKFYTSIYEHGKFIRKHLEYRPALTTNHYLADLAGLFFISIYCPFFKESAAWQEFCVRELTREIKKQVYKDGCDFEASTSYHRLALELFFYCELLGQRAQVKFPKAFRDKVHKMFEFSLYCIKPNGRVPQVGDNDNGRYLIFSSRPILEHKYLLSLAAIYYQNSEFKLLESSFDEEAFWVFGKQGEAFFKQLPVRNEPLKSRAFPDAGWYIMRHNKDYCFISCGPNGQHGFGGHAHNDKLSFELMLGGEDIVVDPGTYCYLSSSEWRNKFRSTMFHNTVYIEGFEQNDLMGDLFSVKPLTEVTVRCFKEDEQAVEFAGEVRYLERKIVHYREIRLKKDGGGIEIKDVLEGAENASVHFCLESKAEKGSFITACGEFSDSPGWYSESYGYCEQIRVVSFPRGNGIFSIKQKST